MKSHSCITILYLYLLILCAGCISNKVHTLKADVSATDHEDMVFVPGGIFIMGSEGGDPDERPAHEVEITPFYIDAHEVTNRQFKTFLEETRHRKPDFWHPDLDRPEDPIVGVSWYDAEAYASWTGKRLPTEAEWEYAARGGALKKKYPWGEEPDMQYANFSSFGIAPVKSFKPNGYGLYDMIGNVWEWCADWYGRDYYSTSSIKNPKGPVTGTYKLLRGGAWYSNGEQVRVTNRYYSLPDSKSFHIGFRCVRSSP
jgi:formylglycine-generating enzyme required for sulfatase activity